MRQVAERAGVSQVTVTNVLRGRTERTSVETRERVLQSVRELGYTPVIQPASQRYHAQTRIIGVNFDQVTLGKDYLAMHVFSGMREAAERYGYDLLLMHKHLPDWAPDREEIRFLDRRSDGFIFVAPIGRRKVIDILVENKIPVVLCCGNDAPDGVGWVMNDEGHNMRLALQHLTEYGHRRIAYLGKVGVDNHDPRRAEYFEMAVQERGRSLEAKRFGEDNSPDPWHVVKEDLLAIREWGATAVVCFNDDMAFRLWDMAREYSLRIPDDLSIIGFDDFPDSAARGLTTIHNDFRAQAALAVESWMALAEGGNYWEHRRQMAGSLIKRASVAQL